MGGRAMEFIGKEKTRMLTFNNRKKSLFKKAYELSVLCDVDVCIIINGILTANQRNNQSQIWPEDSEEVRRIITKYKSINPNARRKTTTSLSSIFPERQENFNAKMPFPVWDSRLDSFSAEQTFKLLADLDQKLKMVDKRIDELQTHVDDQLPVIVSSGGEEQIINEGCSVYRSPPDEIFDDNAMNWVNQNFENDFPPNNDKLLDLPIDSIPENYIIIPDPYIGMPPLDDYSTTATVPSQTFKLLEDLDQKQKMVDKRMDELQTHVDDQLPIIDSSGGEEQIINEGCSVFGSPPDEFLDDDAMNWVNQNFENDFPLNNDKLLGLPIMSMPDNYIIMPDPYIGMPPMDDYSTAATVPSQSCGFPPLPPSSTPSMPFLAHLGMTASGFFDGDYDYQMNDRFWTFDDIANFMWA